MNNLNKPWYKKWWGVLLNVILTILLIIIIAFSFFLHASVKNIKTDQANNNLILNKKNSLELDKILYRDNDNYWIGSANPKITIVEFADFGCHYCANSFPIIRELSLKYKDSVKIIFRDFPVVTEYSGDLALAARCAGEQGLFWVMHDKLFLNQGISQKNDIIKLAKQSGLDAQRFETCLNKNKYLANIQKDLDDGQKLGVEGTPTWFINRNRVAGDIPYDKFVQIIEEMLNRQGERANKDK